MTTDRFLYTINQHLGDLAVETVYFTFNNHEIREDIIKYALKALNAELVSRDLVEETYLIKPRWKYTINEFMKYSRATSLFMGRKRDPFGHDSCKNFTRHITRCDLCRWNIYGIVKFVCWFLSHNDPDTFNADQIFALCFPEY